jgi:hypothetical protein
MFLILFCAYYARQGRENKVIIAGLNLRLKMPAIRPGGLRQFPIVMIDHVK